MMLSRALQQTVFAVIFFAALPLDAQESRQIWYDPLIGIHTAVLRTHDSLITLPYQFLVAGSEIVYYDTLRLHRDTDYYLDARYGIVTLFRSRILPSDTAAQHQVKIFYRRFPFSFQSSYEHQRLVYQRDSLGRQQGVVQKVSRSFSVEDIFGRIFRNPEVSHADSLWDQIVISHSHQDFECSLQENSPRILILLRH